jgi:hypothetical protein
MSLPVLDGLVLSRCIQDHERIPIISQNLTVHTNAWSSVRTALISGVIAGPLYVGVGTLEAVLRSGFDIRIHSLSLLANG